jgi:hypothetical protein
MRILRSLLIAILVLIPLPGVDAKAGEERLLVQRIPHRGNSLHDFLPPGWVVEERASGELNGDGVSDFAAILVQGKPDFDKDGVVNERQRGLIVLLSQKKGFSLAGVNDDLLQLRPAAESKRRCPSPSGKRFLSSAS